MKPSERLKPIPKLSKEERIAKREEAVAKRTLAEAKMNVDSEHMYEGATLDDYENSEFKESKDEFHEIERDELVKRILELRAENESLREENSTLRDRIKSLEESSKDTVAVVSKENVTSEPPESLLRNIEFLKLQNHSLEQEISRLNVLGMSQQKKIDSMTHVYTRSGYDPSHTVRGGGFRTNINGYQDWS